MISNSCTAAVDKMSGQRRKDEAKDTPKRAKNTKRVILASSSSADFSMDKALGGRKCASL
jgi:hypothetical protein